VARIGNIGKVYCVLLGKCIGKRPLGRLKHRRRNNIKIDGKEKGWEIVNRIDIDMNRAMLIKLQAL
jgi:hypothetical protein